MALNPEEKPKAKRRRLDSEARDLLVRILQTSKREEGEPNHALLQRCWPSEGFHGIPSDHWTKNVTERLLRRLRLCRTKKKVKQESIRELFAGVRTFGVRVCKSDLKFDSRLMSNSRCLRILRELGDTRRTARLWKDVRVLSLPGVGGWWSVECSEALVRILEKNGRGIFSLNIGDCISQEVYQPLLDAIERGSVQIVLAWMGQESSSFPNSILKGPNGLLRKNRVLWQQMYEEKGEVPPWRLPELVGGWTDTDWGKPLWHPCIAAPKRNHRQSAIFAEGNVFEESEVASKDKMIFDI